MDTDIGLGCMERYIRNRMAHGERVVYAGSASWIPLILGTMSYLVLLSALSGVAWGLTDNPSVVPVVYAVGILAWCVISVRAILYNVGAEMVITNTHLHSKTGIVRIDNDREATLDRIDRVDVDMHGLIQRFFDYGDIEFQTVGSDAGFFLFKRVAHPYAMKDAYNSARLDYDRVVIGGSGRQGGR